MKPQLFIAATACFVGLGFIVSRRKLCSYGCWLDDLIGLLLPEPYEWLSGGLPWITLGVLLTAQAVRSRIDE